MPEQKSERKWFWFAVLLVLAATNTLRRLGASFWMDEIIMVQQFASKAWLKIVTEVPYPNNHILYTLLAKISISIFGKNEWDARLPAVIAGTLTPPLLYLVLRKRFLFKASLLAPVFLALNFWAVWFSQDARGYAPMILFVLLANYFLLEYLENGGRKIALGYVLCAALAVHFYLYAMFVIAGQGIWVLVCLARKRTPANTLILAALAGLLGTALYFPGLPQLFNYATHAGKMSAQHPLNLVLLKDVLLMAAGARTVTVGLALLILALPGMVVLAKKWPGFVVINLAAAALIAIFTLALHTFIYARFFSFLILLPSIGLGLTMQLIAGHPTKTWRGIAMCLVGIASGILLLVGLSAYRQYGKEDFKGVAAYLKHNYSSGQVICAGVICEELKYYYPELSTSLSEQTPLTPELVKGRVIVSRRVDWTAANLAFAAANCREEKIWPSAGYRENVLWIWNCP